MSKYPSKQKRAWLAAISSLLLLHAGQLEIAFAQERPHLSAQEGAPRQRPRRVGPTSPAKELPRATPAPAVEEVDDGDVVRVDTQLISVPVTVTDRAGRPLTNLRAENFALYEDGRPQRVTNFITSDAFIHVH